MSEGSVASGVRRIEAVTGLGVIELLDNYSNIITESMKAVKATNMNNLKSVCEHTINELKEKDKEIERLTSKLAALNIDSLVKNAEEVKGIKIVKGSFAVNADALKVMLDRVLELEPKAVAVLFGSQNIAVACGKEAQKVGGHSGKIIKEVAALVDGRGGGKPERAMAGIGDVSKINAALSKIDEVVFKFVG